MKVPIRLTVMNYDRFRDALLDYHDGPRYPRLQKLDTGDSGLDKLLTPRCPQLYSTDAGRSPNRGAPASSYRKDRYAYRPHPDRQ